MCIFGPWGWESLDCDLIKIFDIIICVEIAAHNMIIHSTNRLAIIVYRFVSCTCLHPSAHRNASWKYVLSQASALAWICRKCGYQLEQKLKPATNMYNVKCAQNMYLGNTVLRAHRVVGLFELGQSAYTRHRARELLGFGGIHPSHHLRDTRTPNKELKKSIQRLLGFSQDWTSRYFGSFPGKMEITQTRKHIVGLSFQ